MNKWIAIVSLSILGFVFMSNKRNSGKKKVGPNKTYSYCEDNPAMNEAIIMATKADTLNFEMLKKKYPDAILIDKFNYEYMPLLRGMADTSLLNPKYLESFPMLPLSYKLSFIFSPLIIEEKF